MRELAEARFSLADAEFTPVFQRLIDDPTAALEALRLDATAFEQNVLQQEGESVPANAALPYRGFIGYALFDNAGRPVALEEPGWVPRFSRFEDLLELAGSPSPDGRLITIPVDEHRAMLALWGAVSETAGWKLPAGVRKAAAGVPGGRLVLIAGGASGPIEQAASAFGLGHLQHRVVAGLVRTGNLKIAAEELGISYGTAREAMATAARRMALPNSPAVVRAVVAAAFGILPGDLGSATLIEDMLGLTERQARIALLIASGASRNEVALAIGTSAAVVKKELEQLFDILGVQKATELSRVVTEVQALRMLTRSTQNAPGFLDAAIEPSRYTMRADGNGMIAWSDYGPASGRPVLVVHSNWCCRAVPRPLVAELQKRGWRPLAIDRPGFGGTGIGFADDDDPFGQAIDDVLQLLDASKVRRIPIIARCGAQFVHAFKAREPDRVGPAVLVSPTPRSTTGGLRNGAVGVFKEAFFRSPRLIEFFFGIIGAQLTYQRVEQLVHVVTRGAPADEQLCSDPQFVRDRFRALRPFAAGALHGGVREEKVISQGGHDFPVLDVTDWQILQGEQDQHYLFEEIRDYWGALLPGTPIERVAGAGRFMTSSHPQLIVDRLESLAGAK